MTHFPTKEIGNRGEDIAAEYLKQNQYYIFDRNVTYFRDELDIVAFDQNEQMVVFIEVKTRTTNNPAYPIRLAVDKRKRSCMRRACAAWCIDNDYDGPGRTDIICVSGDKVVEHIRELESVFQ